jgi:hypothetical protein
MPEHYELDAGDYRPKPVVVTGRIDQAQGIISHRQRGHAPVPLIAIRGDFDSLSGLVVVTVSMMAKAFADGHLFGL